MSTVLTVITTVVCAYMYTHVSTCGGQSSTSGAVSLTNPHRELTDQATPESSSLHFSVLVLSSAETATSPPGPDSVVSVLFSPHLQTSLWGSGRHGPVPLRHTNHRTERPASGPLLVISLGLERAKLRALTVFFFIDRVLLVLMR